MTDTSSLDALIQALRRLPGVGACASTKSMPLAGWTFSNCGTDDCIAGEATTATSARAVRAAVVGRADKRTASLRDEAVKGG